MNHGGRPSGTAEWLALSDEGSYTELWYGTFAALYNRLGLHYSPRYVDTGGVRSYRKCRDCGRRIRATLSKPFQRCGRCENENRTSPLRWFD